MKKYICILLFLLLYTQLKGQQIVFHVYDASAFAIRGIAIPGMLSAAAAFKNEQASTIIPDIINEEKTQLKKWRKTFHSHLNGFNALLIASRTLVDQIEKKRFTTLPLSYAPGYRKMERDFLAARKRVERLEMKAAALIGFGAVLVDGAGYLRVASQRLAIEYLEVYTELSKIDFKLTKLLDFTGLLPFIAS